MKSYFFFLVFLLCNLLQAQEGFEITGQFTQLSKKAKVFIHYQDQVLDSCAVKNQVFSLRGQLPPGPNDVLLRVKDGDLILQAPLYIGNEKLTIHASKDDFPYDIQAIGSSYDTDRYHYMQSIKNKPKDAINELMQQFITTHINTPFGIKLFDMAKKSFKKEEIEVLFNQIKPNLKFTPAVLSIQNYLQTLDLEPGNAFINFNAFDVDKREFEFAKTFNGKPVLLIFSSLYCHWCENTIPLLEKMHKKLGNQLNIVVFYMDDEVDDVVNFSNKAANPWISIWDPTRTFSNYMQYNVYATPTFYLFDTQGRLIDKIEGFTAHIDELIEGKLNE